MLITNMDFFKLRKTWKLEDQLLVLQSKDYSSKSKNWKIRDILRSQNSMLKSNTTRDICKWGHRPRKMLRMTTDKFGRDRLPKENKKIGTGSSKICMHQLVVPWTSFKWRTVAAEEVREMSSIQILTLLELPTSIHSLLKTPIEQRTNMLTSKWTKRNQEMLWWTRWSTTAWRDKSTRSKSSNSVIKWICLPRILSWVKTCSTVSRERRQWNWWDLTGKPTSRTKNTSKTQALFSNETLILKE